MEHSPFRDYCKAENSEDEEHNLNLQSQLYAEIYYTSNKRANIKSQASIDNSNFDEFHKKSINDSKNSMENFFLKNNFTKNQTTADTINDSKSENLSSTIIDNRLQIKSILDPNEIRGVEDDKSNLNIPWKEVLEDSGRSNKSLQSEKPLTINQEPENSERVSSHNNLYDSNKEVYVKPEIPEIEIKKDAEEEEEKENLTSIQNANIKITTNSSVQNFAKQNIKNINEIEEILNTKPQLDDSFNILKKYDFAKLFINKLYLEKFEKLSKTLEELESKRDFEETDMFKKKVEEEQKIQEPQKSLPKLSSVSEETEKDSKYMVARTGKFSKTDDSFEEILLSSDSESVSEESILEVPIPPKPQPPVINLDDFDEGNSSSNDEEDQTTFIIERKNNKRTYPIGKTSAAQIQEDIILNCAEVQKGAANIQEIRELSKSIQRRSQPSDGSKYSVEDNSTIIKAQESLNNTRKLFDKILFASPMSSEAFETSNFVYERDKTENLRVAMPQNSELNLNRKRRCEDDGASTSAKQRITEDKGRFFESKETGSKETGNKNKSEETFELQNSESNLNRKRHCEDDGPSTSAKQRITEDKGRFSESQDVGLKEHGNKNKNEETGSRKCKGKNKNEGAGSKDCEAKPKSEEEYWEEYFFRPMSERLKAFYNESRGENFDIQEIQSKMSNEDLMPSLSKRQRFWNVKCNNCHHEGHQTYNCPQPRKPPQCHMCGTPGHTETRCPQKMCLTCGKKQGTFRKTCETCRTLYCEMCKAIGHKSNECPDHWRKFHQTTRISEINVPDNLSEVMKPADLLFCCNCTKRGHDSSTCHEYQWSQHFRTPSYVTNYSESPMQRNPQEKDMIPLSVKTYDKNMKIRHVSFPPGRDDLQNCQILFSYGSFETKKPSGEEVVKQFPNEASALNIQSSTTILDQLFKIVGFQIKVFRNPKKVLMVRVRSLLNVAEHIYEMFLFWLNLREEDKKLNLDTNLPRSLKKLLTFLTTKWQQLKKAAEDKNLQKRIRDLKSSENAKNSVSKVLEARGKLLKIFHTKPKFSKQAIRLQKMIGRLQKRAKRMVGDDVVNIHMFVNIIVVYNKLFLPRALTNSEMQFLEQFNEKEKEQGKENEKSKKQKKKCSPYETFLKNLQTFNKSNFHSQSKEESYSLSFSGDSSGNAASISKSGARNNVEEDRSKNTEEEKTNRVAQNPSKENVSKHNAKTTSTVSLAPSTSSSFENFRFDFPKPTKNISNPVPRIEAKLDANTEKLSEAKASSSRQEDEVLRSQKKSKKAKKNRRSLENSSHVEDQALESKAKKIIGEALAFNLPYMNKAVEEVRKRINDGNIKVEHIDMLQRLVNLEKELRQYVSSFCSYLE
ncbi:uncharacterized protein LOC143186835 isoform X2 [Calliopsis andreniformis]|uniref:uncharacterized protein LOC143186835 isoform X2 n=1 Tax=Calliopsis andreniformis TaxID=337506 RepID=UPI003FCD5531